MNKDPFKMPTMTNKEFFGTVGKLWAVMIVVWLLLVAMLLAGGTWVVLTIYKAMFQ